MTDAPLQPTPSPEVPTSSPTPTPTIEAAAPVTLTADAFTLPQGFTLDQPIMDKFLGLMNDAAMSPQQRAQGLLELQASLATQSDESRSQAWNDQRQTWQSEVAADPEIGGTNLTATITNISQLMDKFGNDEVRAAFDETGAGDHPAIVKFLNVLGKQFSEASPAAPGTPAAASNLAIEDRIFGTKKV